MYNCNTCDDDGDDNDEDDDGDDSDDVDEDGNDDGNNKDNIVTHHLSHTCNGRQFENCINKKCCSVY